MTYLLESFVLAAIAVPHLLRLDKAPPGLSALIWLAALMLRAMAAVFGAILVVLYLPTTAPFDLLTHSHWEIGIPGVGAEVSVDGHVPGALALALPGVLLAVSFLWAVARLWRSSRGAARLLRAATVGAGPRDSLVLADREVLIAVAGVRRPRIVVSAGALLLLDDAELAASLEHERGHIARRHRYVLLLGELCAALALPLPGTRSAGRELLFHVERDADQYAIREHDPATLASAICKAAQANLGSFAMALGGGVVSRRVHQLLELPPRSRAAHKVPLQALAAAMVTLALLSASSLPSAAHTSYHEAGHASAIHD